MALEFTVDNLDNVPEDLRGYYIEGEGKYHLNVSGLEDTKGLKSALQKEREAHSKLEKETKTWASLGKTPEEIADLIKSA